MIIHFQLAERVNELDDHGELALELALKTNQDGMAENLVRHKADINHIDSENQTLLHLAIKRGILSKLNLVEDQTFCHCCF